MRNYGSFTESVKVEVDIDIEEATLLIVFSAAKIQTMLEDSIGVKEESNDKAEKWVRDNLTAESYSKIEILSKIYPRYGLIKSNKESMEKADNQFKKLEYKGLLQWEKRTNTWTK